MRSTIFTSLMTNYNVLKVSTILQFLIIILLSRIVYCKTPILSAQIHLLTFEQDKTKDKTKANQTKQDQRPKTKPNKTRPKTKPNKTRPKPKEQRQNQTRQNQKDDRPPKVPIKGGFVVLQNEYMLIISNVP